MVGQDLSDIVLIEACLYDKDHGVFTSLGDVS